MLKPLYTKNRTIGLLGGSFNPAHSGHLHISEYALKRLGLDAVWWLVSPQNPLKTPASLADYSKRVASAQREAASNRRIHVSTLEARHRTRYSYQTIALLQKRYPGTRFVWLMGADNLAHFHRWRRWQWLLAALPIVVFDRAPYSFTSLASRTYLRMRRFLLKKPSKHTRTSPPSLHFTHLKRSPHSATHLRKTLGDGAFLRHTESCKHRN